MLHNPKYDLMSPESVLAWLETKDPDEPYPYGNVEGECALGQYLRSKGYPNPSVGGWHYSPTWDDNLRKIPPAVAIAASTRNRCPARGYRTFGDMLEVLRHEMGLAA